MTKKPELRERLAPEFKFAETKQRFEELTQRIKYERVAEDLDVLEQQRILIDREFKQLKQSGN